MECLYCRLVAVNPRPSDTDLDGFYAQYLHPEASACWHNATRDLFRRDIERIGRLFRHPGSALDVGCGFGFFLNALAQVGWQTSGCDLSPVGVDHARKVLGLSQVRHGAFDRIRWDRTRFDLITFWYVLHHLPDPRRTLTIARQLLRPGGMVAIRVPNQDLFRLLWLLKRFDSRPLRALLNAVRKDTGSSNSPYNVLDPPVHLYAFNRKTLAWLVQSVGFDVVAVYNDGMVNRGNWLNRLLDRAITEWADLILSLTGGRLDLSISLSLYARKP